jgi:hypothetical protein
MRLPTSDTPSRLPRRLPIGATYVVEGFGGGEGKLRVIARYVLLPDGQRINIPADLSSSMARSLPFRRRPDANKRSQGANRTLRRTKKIAGRRGTAQKVAR